MNAGYYIKDKTFDTAFVYTYKFNFVKLLLKIIICLLFIYFQFECS